MITEQDTWELADKILNEGFDHPSLRLVKEQYEALQKVVKETQEQGINLKRYGAGRTEHPTIIMANIVPALEELGEIAEAISTQLKNRLTEG